MFRLSLTKCSMTISHLVFYLVLFCHFWFKIFCVKKENKLWDIFIIYFSKSESNILQPDVIEACFKHFLFNSVSLFSFIMFRCSSEEPIFPIRPHVEDFNKNPI